jgi:tetratricopeptide (TPR) repeat protein
VPRTPPSRPPAAPAPSALIDYALPALALVALTLLAYGPALQGGFVWDDDAYVTANRTLRSFDGLRRIWTEPGVVPQYYPLTFTSLWLEYRLWGIDPTGYHVTNVLLHALAALLLWRVLATLAVPGAWIAAALFALHPVGVESVAWITERKNVLSGALALGALLAYLPVAGLGGERRPRAYGLALALFGAALLAKTVVCVLPAVVLVLVWWKRGRIEMRDVVPLLPFFALGLGLGLVTVWMERYHVGARGGAWDLSLLDRVLVAGRALWFYAATLAWPQQLTFIYPRWQIDATVWWQYLFPAAAAGVALALFLARERLGRGPLAAAAAFALTLSPALGFVDVYPMRYSFVADHFQYHASAALLALAAAAVVQARVPAQAFAPVFAVLGLLTWRQGAIYAGVDTLWQDTLAKNPDCAMAHVNLGMHLAGQGRSGDAIRHYQEALRIEPGALDALNDLGNALAAEGRLGEARAAFAEALRSAPDDAQSHSNLGNVLLSEGDVNGALAEYEAAVRANPRFADAYNNLGNGLVRAGRPNDAERAYAEAVRLDPDYAGAHYNLGVLLVGAGRDPDAAPHLAAAVQLDAGSVPAHEALADVLVRLGRPGDAASHYRMVARSRPDDAELHNILGVALASSGQFEDAFAAYRRALMLRPDYADAHNNLGVALAQSGRANDAIEQFREALRVQPEHANARINLDLAVAQAAAPAAR